LTDKKKDFFSDQINPLEIKGINIKLEERKIKAKGERIKDKEEKPRGQVFILDR
jgi:hypothetical protein